jgi:hypothetical protein
MSIPSDQLDSLRKLAVRFRRAIESCRAKLPIGLKDFPFGSCLDASLLLGHYLEQSDVGKPIYVSGTKDGRTHMWLEMDGVIIDITADQFGDAPERVMVTRDTAWHVNSKRNREDQRDSTSTMILTLRI